MGDADTVLVRRQVLALAAELGSVVEACRRAGISRTTFYEWRRRAQASEPARSSPRTRVQGSHVRAIAPELRVRIEELALAHPGWGCDRIAATLLADGSAISAGTVQDVLNDRRLGTRAERCTVLQDDPSRALSHEQESVVGQHNPRWAQRHERGRTPGARMVAGVASLGRMHGVGRVRLVAVVDTYSGYAFARLSTTGAAPGVPVALVSHTVLPFFIGLGVQPGVIALDPSAALRSRRADLPNGDTGLAGSFDLDAEPDGRAAVNGWIEHLRQLVLVRVFRPATANGDRPTLTILATDLAVWLRGYNHDRPQPGFPCHGRTPWGVIEAWRQRRRRARQGIVLASVLAFLAFAVPTSAHDWHSILRDDGGKPCCHGQDCQRAPVCITPSGREALRFPIPWDEVIDTPSPDGEAHVCWENHPDHGGPTCAA